VQSIQNTGHKSGLRGGDGIKVLKMESLFLQSIHSMLVSFFAARQLEKELPAAEGVAVPFAGALMWG
jgi:hypothetical protein